MPSEDGDKNNSRREETMTGELRPVVGGVDGYAGALGGLGRRDFLKFCTGVAATAGAVPLLGLRIAEAAKRGIQHKRPLR